MSGCVMNMSWIKLDLNNGSFGQWLPTTGNHWHSIKCNGCRTPLSTSNSQNCTIVQVKIITSLDNQATSPGQSSTWSGTSPLASSSPSSSTGLRRRWTYFYSTSLLTFNFLCQIAGLTSVSVQSVKDFLFDEELILLVTGRAFAQFFIFLVAIVPIYLFAITLYPTIREVLPSQSEHC